ncbi:FAD-binding and (Fe-S)-binding domain-containing protein [Anaeromyxobacter terrae]|uniref:FAD-binding and (Fe-S)-binding domain-containing protein n=1 Tax=Anaeromyxobacter terrae TaxID=2925406 RepID=UPI001F5A9A1E|nr:FAD-binding and (Fe-S)-binding domain-containing protein [Anaeromyxobacter sp. SG22]
MQHPPIDHGRRVIPGLGRGEQPASRTLREEIPWGAGAPLAAEAARALEAELRARVHAEVRFDPGSRALYATDGSNYRQVPIGVVVPRSLDDVIATVAVCRAHGAPVLSRGGGTSLAGQCCNVAVVIDFSKRLHAIRALDPEARVARVEPGVVLDDLRNAAERHHLTFGPDPSTHDHCTLGGMIGNDSCGVHSMMAGRTADNVRRLRVLTYDGTELWVGPTDDAALAEATRARGRRGEIYRRLLAIRDRYGDLVRARFPRIPRRVSGYNLDELLPESGFDVARALVGTEGTCVVVLEAEVRLVPSPPGRALLVLGYPDVFQAGDHVPELRAFAPIGLEGIDDLLVRDMKEKKLHPERLQLLPDGRGWLLVEFGGADRAEAVANARRAMGALRKRSDAPSMKLYDDPREEQIVWKVRESGLGATARVPGQRDTWEGWEDSAVAPERLGEYLRELKALYEKYGYEGALYGHFGQGCVHTRVTFDLTTRRGVATYRAFVEEAADLVVSLGGSLSGEHGDGQSRGELLPRMFGDELVEAFRDYKRAWDPGWKMNPGKKIDPFPLDRDLRLGPGFVEARPRTAFRFPEDGGSFGRVATRCVGVGECRRMEGGVMCPSYRATREEKHSTRGRARLLHEMLVGDPLEGGWRSSAVADALHLCLACKGCKSECPMNVDMASYKAEFLHHHWKGRLRPRAAYAMGLVMWWARAAALAPGLVNLLGRFPPTAAIAKALAGMSQRRALPRFASVGFRRWFARRRRPQPGPASRRVVLFPDTFTEHFHPEVGRAAVEALEAAGYAVELPARRLCCGRPLYDYGMLDLARRMLERNLEVLRPALEDGTPIVVLEPSCAAVFRDELPNLLARDPRAGALAHQVKVLAELVDEAGDRFPLGRIDREALVQIHCHEHAVMGEDAERRTLARLGLDAAVMDHGCCGMAGSFGFEAGDRYEVSMTVGERGVLPEVRRREDALVLADGFSCRTQIEQGAGRRALHLAEVIRLSQEPAPPADPERWARERRLRPDPPLRVARAAAALVLAALAMVGAVSAARR